MSALRYEDLLFIGASPLLYVQEERSHNKRMERTRRHINRTELQFLLLVTWYHACSTVVAYDTVLDCCCE